MRKNKNIVNVPKSCQEVFPIKHFFDDGLFAVDNGFFKTYRLSDINYAILSDEQRKQILQNYCKLINSIPTDCTAQISIVNRKISDEKIKKDVYMKPHPDGLDFLRREFNNIFSQKFKYTNNIMQAKYLTISVDRKNEDEARNYFTRLSGNIKGNCQRFGSSAVQLSAEEKIKMLADIFKDPQKEINYNASDILSRGEDIRDLFCPDCITFKTDSADYFKFNVADNEKFARVLFIKRFPRQLSDEIITALADMPKDMVVTITFKATDINEAFRLIDRKMSDVEGNIYKWQARQNKYKNYNATVPQVYTNQQEELEKLYDSLKKRDQRFFYGNITILHTAESIEELNADTGRIINAAGGCEVGYLRFRQLDGLNTVLAFGKNYLNTDRAFLTENIAIMCPFRVQTLQHRNGFYLGQNQLSKELVMVNPDEQQNGNQFILGVSGSGKSVKGKSQVLQARLTDADADIFIIDPNNEYAQLTEAVNGTCIDISQGSENYINVMDINSAYSEKPITLKAEFIEAFFTQLIEGTGEHLSPQHHSIINSAVQHVYKGYNAVNYSKTPPTLHDLKRELDERAKTEPMAGDLSLALEMFTTGTADIFAKQTNVDVESKTVCYNISNLSKGRIRDVGMLAIMDNILNCVTRNRVNGRHTYIVVDEFQELYRHNYTAVLLNKFWTQVRKYNGRCIGIAQNIEMLLKNDEAKVMVENSEITIMLNCAQADRAELAKTLGLDDVQLSYITGADVGCGLVRVGKIVIPIEDSIPKDTCIYRLVTTKPDEVLPEIQKEGD